MSTDEVGFIVYINDKYYNSKSLNGSRSVTYGVDYLHGIYVKQNEENIYEGIWLNKR